MDPQHYRILDMLKPYGKNIEIKYATNGTTLGISQGRTIHDYWPHFRSVAVNVSLDGIHDVYNYIRGNGDFNVVEENALEVLTALGDLLENVTVDAALVGNRIQNPPSFLQRGIRVLDEERLSEPLLLLKAVVYFVGL